MLLAASVWDLARDHVLTFALGLLVGFITSDRYRLVRRNGRDHTEHEDQRAGQ